MWCVAPLLGYHGGSSTDEGASKIEEVLDVFVEDGCCPFKIVFDEDFYVLSMLLCFALSMS